MLLDETRRRELVVQVFAFLGSPISIPVAQTLVGWEAVTSAPRVPNDFKYAEWLVDHVLARASFDAFVAVVQAVDGGGALVELHGLIARIRAGEVAWEAADNPGELWAPQTRPFIDRASLRQTLGDMTAGGGPAVISIQGSLGQGKRTVCRYIERLAETKQSFRPVIAELFAEPGQGALMSVVAELRLQLDLDPDLKTTHEEPERQAELLARDLAQEALDAPIPVWFVANVMDPDRLDEGTLPFIDSLLGLVSSIPEVAAKLRVILLTTAVSLLPLRNPPALHDRYDLPDIARVDVANWLAAAAPGKNAQLYAISADSVFRRLEGSGLPPEKRLTSLAQYCIHAHRKLSATGSS